MSGCGLPPSIGAECDMAGTSDSHNVMQFIENACHKKQKVTQVSESFMMGVRTVLTCENCINFGCQC